MLRKELHMIQAISRALDILEALGNEPRGMTVIALAARMELNRTTCVNIVRTPRPWLSHQRGGRAKLSTVPVHMASPDAAVFYMKWWWEPAPRSMP